MMCYYLNVQFQGQRVNNVKATVSWRYMRRFVSLLISHVLPIDTVWAVTSYVMQGFSSMLLSTLAMTFKESEHKHLKNRQHICICPDRDRTVSGPSAYPYWKSGNELGSTSLCSFGNFPGVWSLKADVSELNVGSIVMGDGTDIEFRNVGF